MSHRERPTGPAALDGSSGLSESALIAWVAATVGGTVSRTRPVTGGNRYRSWAVDVATPGGQDLPLYLRYQMPRPPSAEPYTVAREAGRGKRCDRVAASRCERRDACRFAARRCTRGSLHRRERQGRVREVPCHQTAPARVRDQSTRSVELENRSGRD